MKYIELFETIPTHPRFREWFDESKVVDENGQPLRVFHGTNKVFELPFKKLLTSEQQKQPTLVSNNIIYATYIPIVPDYIRVFCV